LLRHDFQVAEVLLGDERGKANAAHAATPMGIAWNPPAKPAVRCIRASMAASNSTWIIITVEKAMVPARVSEFEALQVL